MRSLPRPNLVLGLLLALTVADLSVSAPSEPAIPSVSAEQSALPDPAGELHAALRTGAPAVLGRLEDGLLLLDCRTLLDDAAVDVVAARVAACR